MKKVYCISDIHNDLDSFRKMLKRIDFSPEDQMYILGDIFDRGPYPFGVYKEILNHENMFPIMGNHEFSLAVSIAKNSKNSSSHKILSALLSECDLLEIKNWILKMPFQKAVTVEGRKYLLAHAGTTDSAEDDRSAFHLWGDYQNDIFWKNGIDGYISVIGHFPTNVIRNEMNEKLVVPNSIWSNEKQNVFAIDCGNGYRTNHLEYVRLGCLRLNDHQCFYV